MLFLILKVLLIFVSFVIGKLLLKDLIAYIRFKKHYAKQGMKYHYEPILGGLSIIYKKLPGTRDIMSNYKHLLNKVYKDNDVVTTNFHHGSKLLHFLNNNELLNKFLAIEISSTKKLNYFNKELSLGFFFDTGHKALESRALFSHFFRPENLARNTPVLYKIIRERFEIFKKELWPKGETQKFKEYELKNLFSELFCDIINDIMFGKDEFPLVDGKRLPVAIETVFRDFLMIRKNPLNLFTGSLMVKFGLHPKSKKLMENTKLIRKGIKDLVERRKKLDRKPEEYGINMIDLMLKHNLTAKEEDKITHDKMISNILLLQLAGVDTTKNSTESLIKLLSWKPEKIKNIEKEVKDVFKTKEDWSVYTNYEKSDYVNAIVSEILRHKPPAFNTFPRVIAKDVKVGKYTFKKGDMVYIPIGIYLNDDKNFKNPGVFDETRWLDEKFKPKRNSYIPFYEGRRACIGKYLAEQLMRMMIFNFFDSFEIDNNGVEPESMHFFVQGTVDCTVKIRPKK